MTILADHVNQQTDEPLHRALSTLAANYLEHRGQPGGDLLLSALQAAIRAAWPQMPISEAPAVAGRLIGQAAEVVALTIVHDDHEGA
ncbi:hypothetical protein ACIBEJ_34560 [Nonomuraea sp. NPDC050790]|uniref:hypothetical protein n=1 Tax=Nonomuraea sp. NPDC050790 TaxID=3364371 RepID=UPI0037A7552F